MNPDLHRRATAILKAALSMPSDGRAAYLDEACGGDAVLRREVNDLLQHDRPDTIVGDASAHSGTSMQHRSRLGRMRRVLGSRRLLAVVAAVVLTVLGMEVHRRLEATILDIRAQELSSVLDADVHALELWVADQKAQISLLAADPRVRETSRELIDVARGGEEAIPELLASPAHATLDAIMTRFDAFVATGGSGVLNADGFHAYISGSTGAGVPLTETMRPYLDRALGGELVFVRPYRSADTHGGSSGTMYTLFLGPLRDEEGAVFGVIGFAQRAYEQFSGIFQVAQVGDTGETYAFDDTGLMLTESRFTDQLRSAGFVPSLSGETPEWDAGAQLNVYVRDPGPLLADEPVASPSSRPLTLIAERAIAASDGPVAEMGGFELAPYRNYRGVEVLGAWRWLPEHGFGVATEIEVAEALAPLWYLDLVFGALFVMLSAAVVATVVAGASAARLRRQVRELGQYRLVRRIAEGGMGTVYLAEHKLMKRPTAVKVLSDAFSDESIALFEQEVRLASELNHPNTIAIYDFGRTHEGVFYYAMEYIQGPTLGELVAKHGPLHPARVVHYLKQICGSLGEAHGKGLVHRDIKPDNIMVCERGGEQDVVKVLDFGLVESIEASSEGTEVGGKVGGTPIYMAPERLLEPSRVDVRMDIYALGAVAYYLLSARPIFTASGDLDLFYRIAHEEPADLAQVTLGAVPAELAALVMECLAKDPDDRPATIVDVSTRLTAMHRVTSSHDPVS